MGVKVEVREIRIGENIEKGREILLLKLKNEEQKWEVMERKNKNRGPVVEMG